MGRKALILASTCGLLLPLAACESSSEKRTEERAEVRKEAQELGQEIRKGGDDIAGKVEDTNKKIGEAADEMAKNRYERFEAYEDEDMQTFASRADAAIQKLETDMQQLRQKSGPQMDDMKDELTDAQAAIDEAKKDLAEVRKQTGKVVDDGRMGVATNINQAQRKLSSAFESMSDAKM